MSKKREDKYPISGHYRKGKEWARYDVEKGIVPGTNKRGVMYGGDVGYAREMLRIGAETGDLKYTVEGVKIYEDLGKSDKPPIKQLVLEAKKKAIENKDQEGYGRVRRSLLDLQLDLLDNFLRKHPSKRKELEHKVISTLVIFGILGGLILLVSSITGNTIKVFNNSPKNIIGIILLIVGIIATFFVLRKK